MATCCDGFELDHDLAVDVRSGRQHGKRRGKAVAVGVRWLIVRDGELANPGFHFFYAAFGVDDLRNMGSDTVDFSRYRVVGVHQNHELSGRGFGAIDPKE